MCGRFYVSEETAKEIEKIIRNVDLRMQRMHFGDIYPSRRAGILSGESTELKLEDMQWGFPQYQRKGLLINARAETALEKKTFRDSVLHRRCVIPARHFYEWDTSKNKVSFFREDSPILYMAGFYNWFEEETRFIILTTQANASVSPVHNRMPLVLEENELETWVYDDTFTEFALHKTPPLLGREQEYEQKKLILT
ncbi:hypothetical protein C808_02596 [Lachnospiraceae bacterium M18-1]|nr:hypothetical protein C808_02596 [Lachnospiraceae bacterium M18-1]